MRTTLLNIATAVLLVVPPLAAELSTATPEHVPGTGFDVLLYQPFDYAYALLGFLLFTALNSYLSARSGKSAWLGLPVGALITLCWFFVAFLAVGQLHLSLGGQL